MNDTQPAVLMTPTQARILREAHDGYVQRVSKLTKATLTRDYRSELDAQGIVILFGGPASKDEMVRAIVDLRYPLAKMNESIHVLYHSDEIVNEVCAYCNPDPCPKCGALDVCDYGSGFGPLVNGRHVDA